MRRWRTTRSPTSATRRCSSRSATACSRRSRSGITDLARRITPVGYAENVKRKIVLAGSPPGYEVDRFLILKVLGVASGIVWIALARRRSSATSRCSRSSCVGFAWGVCFFGPDIVLDGRIKRRREEIERRLPDTLDLLVISVEAGLGFEQALERTATAVPGPLSEESRRMLQETRMGASRADALRALDERTQVDDLRTFILAMLQADAFGVSIARILRAQADEIRIRRRQAAQELSQKAPIKMLFPLAVCIFPAVFVVVLLPGRDPDLQDLLASLGVRPRTTHRLTPMPWHAKHADRRRGRPRTPSPDAPQPVPRSMAALITLAVRRRRVRARRRARSATTRSSGTCAPAS